MNVDRSLREKAGPEMLRGVDRALNRVGMEIDEVGVVGVVAGQQSLLGQPLAVVAAEDGFERLTIGSQDAGRNAEVREILRRVLIQVGCSGAAGARTLCLPKMITCLSCVSSTGLSGDKWSADERQGKESRGDESSC